MAEEQQGQGFKVRDRRILSPDGGQDRRDLGAEQKGPLEGESSATSRSKTQGERPKEIPLPQPTFSGFLTSFFLPQVLTFLGEIPHPETQQRERNLPMAKYLIDTLAIIQEKTRGNLTSEEKTHLDSLLTDLRLLYVRAVEV